MTGSAIGCREGTSRPYGVIVPALSLRHVFAAAVLLIAALCIPTEAAANTVDEPGEANVMCCDGTESPTCAVKKRGCCSHHGGVCD